MFVAAGLGALAGTPSLGVPARSPCPPCPTSFSCSGFLRALRESLFTENSLDLSPVVGGDHHTSSLQKFQRIVHVGSSPHRRGWDRAWGGRRDGSSDWEAPPDGVRGRRGALFWGGWRGQNTPLGLRIRLFQMGPCPQLEGGRARDPGEESLALDGGGRNGTVETDREVNKRKRDG